MKKRMASRAFKKRMTMTYSEAVGLAIRTQRTIIKMSMDELSGYLGMSNSAFSRIEGGVTDTSVQQLRRIAKKLGVSASSILEEAERFSVRAEKKA